MTYEPSDERFDVAGPDGTPSAVPMIRADVLAEGDRPELFFFRVNGEETVVGRSGVGPARLERRRSRLSRE